MQKLRLSNLRSRNLIIVVSLILGIIIVNSLIFYIISGDFTKTFPSKKNIDYKKIASSFAAHCENDKGWRNCYGIKFGQLTRETDNLDDVLKVLQELQMQDLQTRDCHIIAHETMKAAVEKDPQNWEKYLEVIDPNACTYGFIHGVVETRSRYDPTFVLDAKTIPAFCRLLVEMKKVEGVDQTCAHITGHLVLAQENGDIPKAVEICYGIPKNMQRECFSGLFMEQYTRDNLVAHGVMEYIPWTDGVIQEQEHLCNSYDGNAGLGCWQSITSMYLQRTPFDPQEIYRRCSKAYKQEYIDRCYTGGIIGLIQAPDTIATDEYYDSICKRYESSSEKFDECMNFPIHALLRASKNNIDRAIKYCGAIQDSYHKMCYALIGDALDQIVTSEEKADMCQKLPQEDIQYCMSKKKYNEV